MIQTAVISIGIFMGCGLVAAYPLAKWLLSLVITPSNLKEALQILPYGLFSLWITVIASVFQAGLDGYQRIDQRSILLVGGAFGFLIICFFAVPRQGLLGLAYAQVINSLLVLSGSWLMLKRHLVGLPLIPIKWARDIFREIVGYSMNIQAISVFSMLYDPITKSLLAKYGGLSMAGYYDMASRMVLQFRSLIVSANQVLVPAVAELQERNTPNIRSLYGDSYRLIIFISLPLFLMIMAASPAISAVWIGHYESQFVLFSVMLGLGWLVNSLTVPAYFFYMGTGDLFWNVISHAVIGVLNVGLGLLLGRLYGGVAVGLAWVSSLIIGSCLITLSFHYKNRMPLTELLCADDVRVMVGSLIGLLSSMFVYNRTQRLVAAPLLLCMVIVLYLAIVSIPIYRHPMRARVVQWANIYLLSTAKSS